MVWVYEDTRFTNDEEKVVHFIAKRTKNKHLAERTVKLLNLFKYLRNHKFRNAKQIETSAFYDRKHTHPIFNETTAERTFKALKMKGGRSATHPVTDQVLRDSITYIQSWLPDAVTGPANTVYSLVTGPLVAVEDRLPIVRTILKLGKAAAKVGDSAAETLATDVAGPIGEAVVAIPVAIVGTTAAMTSVLEDDLGGAVAQLAQATPFIGSILTTLLDTVEGYYRDLPRPAKGGKRFSTRRRNLLKCPKTRRNKCAMF